MGDTAGGSRWRRLASQVAWTGLLALLIACSDGGTSSGDAGPQGLDLGFVSDVGLFQDSGSGPKGGDSAAQGQTGCEFSAAPIAGQPGAPCKGAGDCDSGYCVEGPDGKICTRPCTTCCPHGFQCIQAGETDLSFVCRPTLLALCRPCISDAECQAVNAGALCLDRGELGRFCGGACQASADCPADYACQDAQGTKGAAKQCVRSKGECTCSAKATEDGAATGCSKVNAAGSCSGQRKCTLQGLSACSAPEPATETCNNQDDDCDGKTDEQDAVGCKTWYPDGDGDGFGATGSGGQCLCVAAPGSTASAGGDCDDGNPNKHPGFPETCNGQDDDCNGQTDEGSVDTDKDGKADCVDDDDDGDGSPDSADCAPLDLAISPSATEVCNQLDDNCNGQTDEAGATGCSQLYSDGDADGFGEQGKASQCLCKAVGLYSAATAGDCDDTAASVHPGASEVCNDVDDDCDGIVDNGCDDDGDGWCDAGMTVSGAPKTCAAGKKDCDDSKATVHPGQPEVCGNGVDDNCDGVIDLGEDVTACTLFYKDGDKDGFGAPDSKCSCAASGAYTASNNQDCDDASAQANPGSQELCGNAKDDNCNGQTDEEKAVGCQSYLLDSDADGYGVAGKQKCLCAPAAPYAATLAGDCDDAKGAINPKAAEACNSIDDNCDGVTDPGGADGCTSYFYDKDADGFGTFLSAPKCLCAPAAPYSAVVGGDCNDVDGTAYPKAQESCNGKDDNCDGATDEKGAKGCTTYYADGDLDGWGVANLSQCACSGDALFSATKTGDCDDQAAAIHPGVPEVCNTKDDDCNGLVDDGIGNVYYLDGDNDSYGIGAGQKQCGPGGLYTALKGGDCDDGNKGIFPGAAEVCNTKDDNCNGQTDEGLGSLFYFDGDGDGWGAGISKTLCSGSGQFTATKTGDCDDADKTIYPGSTESCNGKDDNCNSQTDEGLGVNYYVDADSDGYGMGNPKTQCAPSGAYTATKNGDCNDGDPSVYPNAVEIQCDGKDQDCNGADACNAQCTVTAEDWEAGPNTWTVGPTWQVAAWAASPGSTKGLGFGTGKSYAGVTTPTSVSKAIAIPANAKKMTLNMKYFPDINEAVDCILGGLPGADRLTISFGGMQVYTIEACGWVDDYWHSYFMNLPAGWAGTTKNLVFTFETGDAVYNTGFGAAIDDIQFSCQ